MTTLKTPRKKRPYVWAEQPTVISAMRRAFRRYPGYQEVRNRCKVEWFETCKNGKKRRRVSFKCEQCTKQVSAKDFAVDHIEPVVHPTAGFQGYNEYAVRLFCPTSNLQGLCKSCHREKTSLEAKYRAKARKEKK